MFSWGSLRDHQCGDDAQRQNHHHASSYLINSPHDHGCTHHHSYTSPSTLDLKPCCSPDSACYSPGQNNDSDALSPTGYGGGEAFAGLSLTRQQIQEHNREVGWQQWITLQGNVYDTTSFRDHFVAYNKKKAAESAAQQQLVLSDDIPVEETSEHQEVNGECKLGYYKSRRISDTIRELLQGVNLDEQNSDTNIGAEDKSVDDVDDIDDDDVIDDDDAEEEDYEDDDSAGEYDPSDFEGLWKYDVIKALQKTGLTMREIQSEIKPFMMGTLKNPALPRWKYWDSIRADVLALQEDITSKDSADIGRYEHEYLALLQRWLRKYRDLDPVERTSGGDGNIGVFFLTEDPESLREWMETSPPFDTELPDSGAWASSELLLSPLGDTHDVFSAALRAHGSNKDPFSHDIQGKVAWTELPHDVIKNDQMTHEQQLIHESRQRRGSRVHDPVLMKKRRERLAGYFRKKYRYSEKQMAEYLQWAAVMEKNQRDLDGLCSGHV
ncbi:uncharacterized protein LOC143280900 [Babylonia areolata]|uniref:uncharacterized protein LOC143280900 n=1 Tax=Babylonia areolata TaxID=304850 RepID=UPI003FD01D25